MTRAARSSQWGMGKGRARISREGRGAGATARAGVCPVGEAVRCTRRVGCCSVHCRAQTIPIDALSKRTCLSQSQTRPGVSDQWETFARSG